MNMVIEIVGIDYWEFHDGAEFDITELEMKALKMYKAALLDRLEGDVWGSPNFMRYDFCGAPRN